MEPLITYLFIINAAGFLLMLIDKQKAIRNQYRIPEALLFGTALAGGSLGCLLGMYIVRHKTRKPYFAIGIPLIFLLQLIAVNIFLQ